MGKALLVVALIAIVVYLTIRLIEKRRTGRGSGPIRPAPGRRVIAPDDDPEFLRDLEQKRRREKRRRDEQADEPDGT